MGNNNQKQTAKPDDGEKRLKDSFPIVCFVGDGKVMLIDRETSMPMMLDFKSMYTNSNKTGSKNQANKS